METLEEVTAPDTNKDHSQIVKGKRTKWQRPQSPIPLTIDASSSGDGSNIDCINDNNIASSNDSDDEYFLGTITEEDENMAKCLILLARGRHNLKEPSNENIDDQEQNFRGYDKFTSKKAGAGVYVYECKTCGRTFPSFQALGGHRASHKKPKNKAGEEKKMSFSSSDEEEEPIMISNKRRIPCQLSLELSSGGRYSKLNRTDNSKSSTPKVHDCSYCGAEFTSGQALGGHMRRHRGDAPPLNAHTNLSFSALSLASMDQDSDEAEAKRPRINLPLDLNLPAPEDDHHNDSKFALVPKQQSLQQPGEEQQTALSLST